MVEQTRRPHHVVSLQAGLGEANTGNLFVINIRVSDRAARALGQQLAVIGDRIDLEWASRRPTGPPNPLHLLRPAQMLTQNIYRDIHSNVWSFQGLFSAVKAWIESALPGQGILRPEALPSWMPNVKPVARTGWTRGTLVTVALVAAVSVFGALWVEGRA